MEEWATYKLGEIAECSLGKMLDQRKNKGKPRTYLGNVAVRWGSINIDPTQTMLFEDHELEKYSLKKNDIVICEGGEPGRCAIWKSNDTILIQKALHRVRVNAEIADPLYVYYYITHLAKSHLLEPLFTGSTIKHLPRERLVSIEIRLPDLSKQKQISSILTTIDDKRYTNSLINDNLEQQAKALYKSWFVDFEPFKEGKFIESELGVVPEGWQCIPFNMFVSESKAKTGEIGIKEFSVTNNGIFPRDAKYNKSLSQSSAKNKLITCGDLVFGMSRDILNWGVMREERGGVSSAYSVYNINSEIVNSTYLELFIKSRIYLFSDLIRPAAREGQSIDKSLLLTKVLLLPPQDVLDTFWPLYNSVTNQIRTKTTEIASLSDIRDTLLPKLMSGELKINEIDC